jgi:hypothetical protein
LYHRERICFSSTLSCIKEAEKITKPLTLSAGANFNQPGNFWARQPISINQATFGLVSPFQSTRQLLGPSALFNQSGNIGQHMAWNLFLLPASTADSTLLPHSQGQMNPHTPPPLLSMASSKAASWPRYGHLVIPKVQLFQRRKGAFCTGLPPGMPIKENLKGSILQSEASDRHRHTLRGHNLNYTIWILYAESVSF